MIIVYNEEINRIKQYFIKLKKIEDDNKTVPKLITILNELNKVQIYNNINDNIVIDWRKTLDYYEEKNTRWFIEDGIDKILEYLNHYNGDELNRILKEQFPICVFWGDNESTKTYPDRDDFLENLKLYEFYCNEKNNQINSFYTEQEILLSSIKRVI
jgi:hypothetical protein